MKQESQNRKGIRALVVLGAAVLLLAADQITKYYVLQGLKPAGSVTVIGGLLEFSYVENTGAAFGILKNQIWLVTAVALAAFAAILVLLFCYRRHTFFSLASSALLLAGGIGNLIDRIRFGFVVDFIHVLFFPYIFNFADCCVTVGAALFVIHVLLLSYRERKQASSAEVEEAPKDGQE